MEMVSDTLMLLGTLGAGFYCLVLSRRLTRFTDLERGVGGAVAILSVQVDEMTKALDIAKRTSEETAVRLDELTRRAEGAASRLELMMAALHDVPESQDPISIPRAGRAVLRNRRLSVSESEERA